MVLAGRAIYGEDIQRLRERMQREDYATGAGRLGNMDDPRPSTRGASSAIASWHAACSIVVDSGNGIPGASAPGILRALGCEVIDLYSRGRRRFSEPPPGPEQAGEPGRPDQGRACHRCRAGPRIRRRWRPAGRRHARRPDHLPRSPVDAARARRARAQSGRQPSSTTSSAASASAPTSAQPAACR